MKKKKRVKVYHKMEVRKKYYDDIARGILHFSLKSILAFAFLLLLLTLFIGTLFSGRHRAKEAEKYYLRGLRHEELKEDIAARVEYRKVLQLDENHRGALLALGKMDLLEGHYLTAIHRFHRVLDEGPPSAEIFTLLASALLGRGEIERASGYLQRAIDLDPEFTEAKEALAAVQQREKGTPSAHSFPSKETP